MWSDPEDHVEDWGISPRGAGWLFGEMVTTQFLKINNLTTLVRAHQMMREGWEIMHENKRRGTKLVSIWSAPNYCYRVGNKAAVMDISANLTEKFRQFEMTYAN